MSTYEIHETNQYDELASGPWGQSVNKCRTSRSRYDSHHMPEEGDSCVFEEDGRIYQSRVVSVRSNGYIYDDVESLDVECVTKEILPRIEKKESKGGDVRYGVVNGKGKTVIPFDYDEIEFLPRDGSDYVKVRKNGKWGVFNSRSGSLKLDIVYDEIRVGIGGCGYFKAFSPEGSVMLDEHFKPLPASLADFKEMTAIGSGYFIVRIDGQDTAGVVNKDLEVVLPLKYRRVTGIGWGLVVAEYYDKEKGSTEKYLFSRKGELIQGDPGTPVDLERWSRIPKEGRDYYLRNYRGPASFSIPGHLEDIDLGLLSSNRFLESIHVSVDNPRYASKDGILYDKEKTVLLFAPPGKVYSDRPLKLPASVTRIQSHAFANSTIKRIVFPEGLQVIGFRAFCRSAVTEISIPASMKEIGNEAFLECSSLKSLSVPDSPCLSVSRTAFQQCSYLRTVSAGYLWEQLFYQSGQRSAVTTLQTTRVAFRQYRNIIPLDVEVVFLDKERGPYDLLTDDGKTWVDEFGVTYSRDRLKLIKVPGSVKEYIIREGTLIIGERAFEEAIDLECLLMPDSILVIEQDAFPVNLEGLSTVDVPETVETIGERAFSGLPEVRYLGHARGFPWGARRLKDRPRRGLVSMDDSDSREYHMHPRAYESLCMSEGYFDSYYYQGEFVNGLPHGHGALIRHRTETNYGCRSTDSIVYEGRWKEGKTGISSIDRYTMSGRVQYQSR